MTGRSPSSAGAAVVDVVVRGFSRGVAALGRLRLRRRPITRQLAVDGALLVALLLLVSVERVRGQLGVLLIAGAFVAHLWAARTRGRNARPRSADSPPETAPSQE